jgi:hypothetical protein
VLAPFVPAVRADFLKATTIAHLVLVDEVSEVDVACRDRPGTRRRLRNAPVTSGVRSPDDTPHY